MERIRIESTHEIQNNGREGAYFGSCWCGWRGPYRATIEESTKDAVDHSNNRSQPPNATRFEATQ